MLFGADPAVGVQPVSATSIRVRVPNGAQSGSVKVVSPDGPGGAEDRASP